MVETPSEQEGLARPASLRLTSRFLLFRLSLIHLGTSFVIVAISSFLNSELKFLGWRDSVISLFLGITIIFELIRIYFGYLNDNTGKTRFYIGLGYVFGISGILMIPLIIHPVNNLLLIPVIGLFFAGSAITTTLIDTYMITITDPYERNRVSGILQTARLSGFALGGIVGAQIYQRYSFNDFIKFVLVVYVLTNLISLLSMKSQEIKFAEKVNSNFSDSIHILGGMLKKNEVLLMTTFLILYALGLFMQDFILEPYAINEFDFDKEDVGIVVTIWSSLTLIFVPFGSFLEPKINRYRTVVLGLLLSSVGILSIGLSSSVSDVRLFYFGLILFGIGNGIASSPGISMMLDIAASEKSHMTILLGFFGILISVGRSFGSIIAAVILELSDTNYVLFFIIESVVILLTIIPIQIMKTIMPEITSGDHDKLLARSMRPATNLNS